MFGLGLYIYAGVSTHSRLKAAGICTELLTASVAVSTHSRLKAAGDDVLHDLRVE